MYILIKNQEGENMNLLSQNTDFNALLAAMKTDIEAEYEKATGSAINLDEDSGSDYEVGINVEDSAADGFCLASGYMYGADSNFDWGIFKLTPPTIEIVGFLGGAARFIAKPCLKQRVMWFPIIHYGCSA
jgi:hypothetical protein